MRKVVVSLALLLGACAVPDVDFTGTGDGGTDATDAPAVVELVVSTGALTVTEGGQGTFTVALSAPPASAVLVSVDSIDDNRVGVTPSSVSFDGTNWNQPRTITASGREDADTENEVVQITVSSSVGDATVDVTVNDNDQLRIIAAPPTGLDVTEGSTASITVHLSAQPSGPVTVNVVSGNPAALTATPATLSFGTGTWDLDQTVVLTGIEDADIVNGSADITLSATGLLDTVVPVQVIDDDVLGILPSTTNLGVLAEGATTTFTVRLTQQPTGSVGVTVGTSDAMVLTAAPGTLTFDAATWSTPQTVTVTLPQDVDTTDESATVTLSATGLNPRTVSASIDDDDVQAVVAAPGSVTMLEGQTRMVDVHLAFQPAADVTLGVTSLNPALATAGPATLTFTPANYAQNQVVTVTAVQDPDALSAMTTVRVESVADALTRDVGVAVTDDDQLLIEASAETVAVTEGMTVTFGVRLTAAPAAPMTVNGTSADPSAVTLSPAMLMFTPANFAAPQMITVTGVNDVDLAAEMVTLTLSAAAVPNETVVVNVADDDMQTIVASAPALSVNEGGTGQVAFSLGFMPAANTIVNVASSDIMTATLTPSSLTFTPANYASPQNVTITGVNDADIADDTATINATATGATPVAVAVTVNDDDSLGIETSVTTINVPEAGTGTVGVTLTAQPAASVTVMVSSSDIMAATVAPTSLTFTTANWNMPQNVTLTGVADADGINDAVTVTLTATGLTTRTVNVTVVDDDTQDILLTAAALTVGEAGSGTFGVRLATMPAADVMVTVATANAAEATAAPTSLTFTPANYANNQTVTVSGVDDVDLVSDTVAINMSSAGLATRTVTVTVTDDDMQTVLSSATGTLMLTEGGAAVSTGFSLRFMPAASVTVTLTPGTGITVTPGTLTFTTANYANVQNVAVSPVADANAADVNTMLTASAPSATSAVVPVFVDDDEVLELDVTPASLTVGEGGTGSFNVRLTAQPLATTSVNVASSDATAASVPPAALSFTTSNWNVYQAVTVTGVQDADLINDAATITVSSTGLPSKTVGVTVTDDDLLTIVLTTTSLNLAEGGSGTVGVSLSNQPPSAVAIAVASGDTTAVSATPATLNFTTANWNVVQNVTATAINDADATDETVAVMLTGSGVPNRTFTVAVTDDDMVLSDLDVQMGPGTGAGQQVTYTGIGFNASTVASLNGRNLSNQTVAGNAISGLTPTFVPGEDRFAEARVMRGDGVSTAIPRAFYFGSWAAANNGLYGGRISALAAAGSSRVYAGTDNGVYRSLDNGNSWSATPFPQPTAGATTALVVDPTNQDRLFAATPEGIYRTTDAGTSWTLVSSTITNAVHLAMASQNTSQLYAVSGAQVYTSSDGGNTWIASGITFTSPRNVAPVYSIPSDAYLATGNGLYRTTDFGSTWQQVSGGFSLNVHWVTTHPFDSATAWVAAANGVYRTQGANWQLQGNISAAAFVTGMVAQSSQSLYATTSTGFHRSTNAGVAWSQVNAGFHPAATNHRALAMKSVAPNDLFVGNFAWGVYRSTDQGQTWTSTSVGLDALNVDVVAAHPTTQGTAFVAPDGIGLWKSTDQGASWRDSSAGFSGNYDVYSIGFSAGTPSTMWVGMNGAGVRKSTDSGASWTNTGMTAGTVYDLYSTSTTVVYAGTGTGFQKSIDGGASWTTYNTGLPAGSSVRSIIGNATGIYCSLIGGGVYRSTDGGETWSNVTNGVSGSVTDLVFDVNGALHAQTAAGTYKSTNNGVGWSLLTTSTAAIAFDPFRAETVYMTGATAVSGGMGRSLTGVATIYAFQDGLPSNVTGNLAVDATGKGVYLGSYRRGLFRLAPN